jgi:hypothetical protein
MRPGRIKHKARARRRRVAVTCAGVSALTVMGGTTAFASSGGGWDGWGKHDGGEASLENGGDAKVSVDQSQYTFTAQLALANTGANKALGLTGGLNLGSQDCAAGVEGGDIKGVDDDNTTGNSGGDCTNDATQSNDGTTNAKVETGAATGKNDAKTTVNQKNEGGAAVNNSANDNTIEADDEDAWLSNGGNANVWVDQHSGVETWQGAAANSGKNVAVGGTIGVNLGGQYGVGGVGGGNIGWSGDGNQAGNQGGNASNTAGQTNTGSTTAWVKTGAATASNTSATTVNQTNTGSASSTNTANGNNISTN